MFYRINHISFDASRKDEFLSKADAMRDQIAAVPGLNMVNTIEIGEGKGIIIGRYETAEAANNAQESVQQMMGALGEFFTAPPEVQSGSVIWNWEA